MADSILRLKVDSQEYDQKIKRAAEGIQQYAQKCRDAGGTLQYLDDGVEEFVRALGQMDTVSKSAKGSVNELTRAFTDLSVQYNRLTDEEKQSPFGKALSSSLDELKGRIQSGNAEIKNIGESLNGGGGLKDALDAVAGKFGLNIGQLTKFGGALAAAKTALDTVKGAIESTEATHDALARAISVTDNVTNQFLRSLATADFSNFINGLQSIIDKTIDAYNAMDEFESYAARFQPWQQAKESQIQTKIMQARAAKAKGENDRAEQLNNEAKQLIQELAKSTKAYGEKQTTGGFATIRSLMGQVNISNQQIAWYADPKNWEEAQRKAKKFADIQERITQLRKEANGYKRANETDIGYAMRIGGASREANRLEEMLRRDQSLRRAYTMQNLRDSGDSKQAQQFRQALGNIYGNTLAESRIESLMARADRMEGMLTRSGGGGGGGKGGNADVVAISGSIDEQTQKVQELQKAWRAAANDNSRQKIKAEIEEQQYILDRMTGKEKFDPTKMQQITDLSGRTPWATPEMLTKGTELTLPLPFEIQVNVDSSELTALQNELKQLTEDQSNFGKYSSEAWQLYQDKIDEVNKKIQNFKGKDLPNQAEESAKAFNSATNAISSVGSALQSIEDPGVKVAGIISQAIATIAQTFAASLKGTFTPWDWIAGAAAGTATMISTIAAIKSATTMSERHAGGGFIGGKSYSGDNVMMPIEGGGMAALSSGELVLNRAQQGVIAGAIEGGGFKDMNIIGILQGEDMALMVDRWGRRTGKGELAFWK